MGKYTEYIKEHKIILLSVSLFLILLLGYIGLLLYKHWDYEKYGWLYDLYDENEKAIIIRASINYWIIAAVIVACVAFITYVGKSIYDRQQEYRLRSLYSSKANSENSLRDERKEPSFNKLTTVCFYIWIIRNLIRVIIQFGYIINGIDTGIHVYNVIVGVLICVLLYKMLRGNKMGLFLFYLFEVINGLVISQIENDSSSLLFSFFASIIVSILLLFKNKSGQTGYDIMFNKESGKEKSLVVSHPFTSKDSTINQDFSKSMTDEPQGLSKKENINSDGNHIHTVPMYCNNCGKNIDADSLYCSYCGKQLK